MATGIVEVLAKAGFDVRYVARGAEKVAGSGPRWSGRWTGRAARQLAQADRDAALARVAGRPGSTTWPTATW